MRSCQICGKKTLIQKSGAHQYGGGWAMRATKKRFEKHVNLHSAKVTYNPKIGLRSSSMTAGLRGVRRTIRLCTKCLRQVKKEMNKVEGAKKEVKKPVGSSVVPITTAA